MSNRVTPVKSVLNVVPLLSRALGGGVAERCIQFALALGERGYSVTTLTLDLGIEDSVLESLGHEKVLLLPTRSKRFLVPSLKLFLISRAIKQCDVIHLSNHWSLLNALVFAINFFYKKPLVICPAGSLQARSQSYWIKTIYNSIIGRRVVTAAQGHIAITELEINDFEAYGVPPEMVKIVPNGVARCHTTPVNDHRQKISSNYILFLGRLNKIKGVDILLTAYLSALEKGYINCDLVFAGPDEGELGALVSQASEAGCGHRVKFTGFISGEEKRRIIRDAEVMVIPSRSEAMSIVVLEAAVEKTPVVCTDKCGLEFFASQEMVMMTSANVDGLEGGLCQFFQLNEVAREQYTNRFYDIVISEFSWDKMAERYDEIFSALRTS